VKNTCCSPAGITCEWLSATVCVTLLPDDPIVDIGSDGSTTIHSIEKWSLFHFLIDEKCVAIYLVSNYSVSFRVDFLFYRLKTESESKILAIRTILYSASARNRASGSGWKLFLHYCAVALIGKRKAGFWSEFFSLLVCYINWKIIEN